MKIRTIFKYLVIFLLFLPLILLMAWSFTGSWPWPNIYPKTFTLRGFEGIDFINKKAGMKTHTIYDTPDKFDEDIAAKFVDVAISTVKKIF